MKKVAGMAPDEYGGQPRMIPLDRPASKVLSAGCCATLPQLTPSLPQPTSWEHILRGVAQLEVVNRAVDEAPHHEDLSFDASVPTEHPLTTHPTPNTTYAAMP